LLPETDDVSIEFADTSEVLDYYGGAIIVNTAIGAGRPTSSTPRRPQAVS
jgi:hypothetical protein